MHGGPLRCRTLKLSPKSVPVLSTIVLVVLVSLWLPSPETLTPKSKPQALHSKAKPSTPTVTDLQLKALCEKAADSWRVPILWLRVYIEFGVLGFGGGGGLGR